MSLARLWQRQGRRDDARVALGRVYDTYTEGFTTPDLVDAKLLLESLASVRPLVTFVSVPAPRWGGTVDPPVVRPVRGRIAMAQDADRARQLSSAPARSTEASDDESFPDPPPGGDVSPAHCANEAATMGPVAIESDTSAEAVFRAGDVVAARFRIVRYLARGGMGELYEADDLELRERVALKTILSSVAESERSIALFKREVHLARQVTHPNVCRIFDVYRHRPPGGADQEVIFLAMELLRGETLADRRSREGRFTTTDSLPIARQMAAGLAAAHRAGVVHRDFKSANVMLVDPTGPDEELRAVVTDFGLAQRSARPEVTAFSMSFTDAGVISGTPAYMAPEQVEGPR